MSSPRQHHFSAATTSLTGSQHNCNDKNNKNKITNTESFLVILSSLSMVGLDMHLSTEVLNPQHTGEMMTRKRIQTKQNMPTLLLMPNRLNPSGSPWAWQWHGKLKQGCPPKWPPTATLMPMWLPTLALMPMQPIKLCWCWCDRQWSCWCQCDHQQSHQCWCDCQQSCQWWWDQKQSYWCRCDCQQSCQLLILLWYSCWIWKICSYWCYCHINSSNTRIKKATII